MALGFAVALVAVAAFARRPLNVPSPPRRTPPAAIGAADLTDRRPVHAVEEVLGCRNGGGLHGWYRGSESLPAACACWSSPPRLFPRLESCVLERLWRYRHLRLGGRDRIREDFVAIRRIALWRVCRVRRGRLCSCSLTLPGLRLRIATGPRARSSPGAGPRRIGSLHRRPSSCRCGIRATGAVTFQLACTAARSHGSGSRVLLSLYLLASWVRRAAGSTSVADELVLIPLSLLALASTRRSSAIRGGGAELGAP